ncbi:MAG TPA: hypothetical protein VL989_00030 [Candidatus Sulfotelmatobacter sp.]|nr:hypothetical protein [Candidatus Sulfotelmatobacter sp.]
MSETINIEEPQRNSSGQIPGQMPLLHTNGQPIDYDYEGYDGPSEYRESEKKFDHSQSYISFFRKNRLPGIKRVASEHGLGAAALATALDGIDYLTASGSSGTNLYSKNIESLKEREIVPQRPTAEGNLGRIEVYSKLFQNPAYVPAEDEYEELSALRRRIATVHPKESEKKATQYFIKEDGERTAVNPHSARLFLDNISPRRWQLDSERLEEAEKALLVDSPEELLELQKGRRREDKRDILSYKEFISRLEENELTNAYSLEMYREYLRRRVNLSRMILSKTSYVSPWHN